MGHTYEERCQLATVVVKTLDEWGLTAAQAVVVMGLPDRTRSREIVRYRQGTALPDDEAVIERCGHVLAIQHGLDLLFPHNPLMAAAWITDPGNRLFGRSPLEVMLDEGLKGLRRVRRCVEHGSEY